MGTLMMQKKHNKYFKIIMETSLGDQHQVADILLIEAEHSRMKLNTNKYLNEIFDELWSQDPRDTSKINNINIIPKNSCKNSDIKCVYDEIAPSKDYLKAHKIKAKYEFETASRLEKKFTRLTYELLDEEKNIMSKIKECFNDLQENLRFLANLKNENLYESCSIVERTNHLKALLQKNTLKAK